MINNKIKTLLVILGITFLTKYVFADMSTFGGPVDAIVFPLIGIFIVGAVIAGIVAIVIYVLRRIKKKSVIKIKK